MTPLPIPPHFDPDSGRRGGCRTSSAAQRNLGRRPGGRAEDEFRPRLLAVDVQHFCIPDFELFVAGRSGTGAVDDNRRLCEFIYRNLGTITRIFPSLDTHRAMQIFHPLADRRGRQPHRSPTRSSRPRMANGRWRVNPAVAEAIGLDVDYAARHLAYYTRRLADGGKFDLTIWLTTRCSAASATRSCRRSRRRSSSTASPATASPPSGQGRQPAHRALLDARSGGDGGLDGDRLDRLNTDLIDALLTFDAVVVAGQAKSHCVAWTIDDLISGDEASVRRLAEQTYLLEDCTSPVVVPGVVDYTDSADEAFARYEAAGMNVVRSTDPIESWPGLRALGDRSQARVGRYSRPTLAPGRSSTITTSAVKSFAPRISDEPTRRRRRARSRLRTRGCGRR